jgi:hypothetical protein
MLVIVPTCGSKNSHTWELFFLRVIAVTYLGDWLRISGRYITDISLKAYFWIVYAMEKRGNRETGNRGGFNFERGKLINR